jgi:hypothetical protein
MKGVAVSQNPTNPASCKDREVVLGLKQAQNDGKYPSAYSGHARGESIDVEYGIRQKPQSHDRLSGEVVFSGYPWQVLLSHDLAADGGEQPL